MDKNNRDWRTAIIGKELAERGHEVFWWTSTFDHILKRYPFSGCEKKLSGESSTLFPLREKHSRRIGEPFCRMRFKLERDESAIRSDYHSGITWALKGKTPVVPATGTRFRVNMLPAIGAKGALHFMVTEKNVTSSTFIDFLERLIHDSDQPVYLIVDRHPVHRSAQVQKYVASTEGRLRIFHLPPDSPELSSDEQVRNYVKNHGIGRMLFKGLSNLKDALWLARIAPKFAPNCAELIQHPDILFCSMFATL